MRRWLSVLLIAANFSFAAWAYRRLPELVSPNLDLWIPWSLPSGEPMPRAVAAFALPTAALFVALLLTALASPFGERLGRKVFPAWLVSERTGTHAVDRFAPTFETIVVGIVASLFLIHVGAIATMLGWPSWTVRASIAGIGLLIVATGNVMPRTRPNWIAGLRTKAAMSDPDLWRATHRRFGALLMLTGVVVIALAIFATPYALLTGGIGALVSAIVASLSAPKGDDPRNENRSTTPAVVMLLVLVLPIRLAAQPMIAPPSPPADVIERSFDVTSSGLVLPGTLAMPAVTKGRIPVAIIVVGSGPTDRNGNGPLTQTDLYAQLAWALARGGIASVRYDKRGIGEGARTIDHTALTIADYVNDVAAVARSVAADSRFSKVFLVGHSEGAGHVLQAANRGVATAGVAMLAGTGRPLGEVLHDQFALQVDASTLQRIDSAFARFIRGEDVPDAPEAARPVLVPVYRRMIASMAAYDPAAEIARVRVPVLIVQGETDLQVTSRDSERLRAAQPAAKSVVLRSANHVFKATASRDAAAQQPLYRDRTLPMVPELGVELISWIKGITDG